MTFLYYRISSFSSRQLLLRFFFLLHFFIVKKKIMTFDITYWNTLFNFGNIIDELFNDIDVIFELNL